MAEVKGTGPIPKEALDYLRSKGIEESFHWAEVYGEEHANILTVARSSGYDILGDVKQSLEDVLAEGKTYRQWAKELTPTLQKKGWWGRPKDGVVDKRTGEWANAELGSPRRLKTIYHANTRSARAAGRWERIQRTKKTHPYLLYQLGPSKEHRPEHVAFEGILLPVDDPFWQSHYPPNGWNCFPAETLVRCDAKIGLKTWYSGEMVELHTRLGHRLTVTANHPILTINGWVAAHCIQEGSQLIGACTDIHSPLRKIVNHKQPPARANDLFEALRAQGFRVVPMASDDFHGDALLRKPEIHIAGADSTLMNVIEGASSQFVGEGMLQNTLHGWVKPSRIASSAAQAAPVISNSVFSENAPDSRFCDTESSADRCLTGQTRAVQRQDHALSSIVSGVGSDPCCTQDVSSSASRLYINPAPPSGIATTSPRNASIVEDSTQGSPANAELFGQLLEANTGLISADEVVFVRKFDWSGHVYDFSTDTGLIVAGGIVVSNCKCWVRQVSKREYERLSGTGKYLTEAPEIKYKQYKNKATGEIVEVPVGIDPGWEHNPGIARQKVVLKAASEKLAVADPRVASKGIEQLIDSVAFRRWWKKPKGDFPIGVVKKADAERIGAKVQTAVVSEYTRRKQIKEHIELEPHEYLLIQKAFDHGEVIQDTGNTLIYIWEAADTGYVTIVKATRTGLGLFVDSYRRLSRNQAKRDKEIQRLRDKAK